MGVRINVGCGRTPVQGWDNYDNSLSIRLARLPFISNILGMIGVLAKPQQEFILFAKTESIIWADASKYIPKPDGSVDVVYSSHMIEHLSKDNAKAFLNEAYRIMKNGGIIRIAVPNIKYHIENYLQDGDSDNFINKTNLGREQLNTFVQKIKYLIVGDRSHKWMYDKNSLCSLLSTSGFNNPRIMEPGTTIIPESEPLNLFERYPESIFVEALKIINRDIKE